MHILLLTQEPPFDASRVVTGNAIRARQLLRALESAGHTTRQAWLDTQREAGDHGFDSADRLRGLILRQRPDVILVGYWELLSLLPWSAGVPVVLDFVAPRPLEVLFEHPERLGHELRRLRANLRKADLLLVGNQEQAALLTYWLLEAGHDLRRHDPVRVVPLAGEPVADTVTDPSTNGWTVVGGGVSWPWRDATNYSGVMRELAARHAGRLRFVEFGGGYRLSGDETDPAPDNALPMTAYRDYSAFLAEGAHIGLELGDNHIERRVSQSFRSLDFLRHGLPLICNRWLPIARWVEHFDAGWLIDDPADLAPLLEGLMGHPDAWREKRENAFQLTRKALDPERAARPLIHWLENPATAPRLPRGEHPGTAPPVIGKPPLAERLRRRYRLVRRALLHRCLGRKGKSPGDAVVLVSRGDVFPTDHGAAVKIVETARGISRQGRDVLLVSDRRDRYWRFADGDISERRFPAWVRLLARPLAWVKLDHYTRDLPESNAFLYLPLTDGSFFWRTLAVAARHDAGVLQAEFPAYALPCVQAGEVLGLPSVLVEHNVEYDRLKQQVPDLTPAQYEHLRDIEIGLANRCDAVVCVSDNDRQRLAEDGVHPSLLHTLPHGISLADFDAAEPVDIRSRLDIPDTAAVLVYHGTFAYPPNRDALQMFADEILPRLEAAGREVHVLAVGHQPPAKSPHPRIHMTGSVESVAPWLKAADMAVVPLREGGGTRMKIIDCFAARLPVVSTPKGIEGIPVSDGVEALIREDWDGLCAAVLKLLAEPGEAQRLAQGGRNLAESLDWTAIGGRYVKLFSTL